MIIDYLLICVKAVGIQVLSSNKTKDVGVTNGRDLYACLEDLVRQAKPRAHKEMGNGQFLDINLARA